MKNLIVANWKNNPASLHEAKKLFGEVKNGLGKTNAEVVICPPFVFLAELKGLTLGAQNVFYEEKGAFTGEVSAEMLKSLGVEFAIIGHSEVRNPLTGGGETDKIINKKIKEALSAGLKVILCVGESTEERSAGKTKEVLERELKIGLNGVSNLENLNVAYEPIWAISDGDPYKTKELPSPEKTKEISLYIRRLLTELYNLEIAEKVRILYGGSANAENSESYLKDAGIQGLLVGGASLDAEEFVKIVKSAE